VDRVIASLEFVSRLTLVGVVPNSLQDIGRASDGAKRSQKPAHQAAAVHTRGAGGGALMVRYIYLARVSWRLDSLVSRHRRVTQNS
jgi:hypothetical protein